MRKSALDAIKAELEKAKAISATAEKEDRELTDGERDAQEAAFKSVETMQASFEKDLVARKKMTDQEAFLRAQTASLVSELGLDSPDGEKEVAAQHVKSKFKGLGDRFLASDEFNALIKNAPGGVFSKNVRVQSGVFHTKDLFTGADHDESAGALTRPDYRGLLDPFYERPLTVRQIVSSGNTTTDTIEYVRLVSTDNNAAVVPEATTTAAIGSGTPAVTAAQGGLKPESGFSFEKDSTTVKTIAHWIPATKRALSDAAQIRTMIDSFLRYGLEEALEDELLSGNGTGEHFLGIANTPGIQTQAAPTGGQDTYDVLRIARRKVRIGGRATPSAYVMNPIDWEELELRRDANGQFYGGGPFNMTTPRIWGLPIVESEAIPAGTAYVADWNWAVLYDREQASIQVTDAHADFFIRNLVAILAEMRAAFAILRPAAFVKISL